MNPQEWLRNVSQDGLANVSPFVRSLLSRLEKYDEETLWILLVLLSACFSDLAKAGHVNSLPANMDPSAAADIFTHLSSTMADAAKRLSGPGNESSDLPESDPSFPQEGL